MAVQVFELPETYASITRPVSIEIIRQLMRNLEIDQESVPIFFPGANGKVTTWNANNIEEVDSAQFTSRERVLVQVKEDYIEDDLLTLVSKRKEHPPIFWDRDLGIQIYPIYSRTKVTVSFTYRTRDRWQAESFRDNWRRKIAENREYMTFNAHYKYPIPEIVEKIFYLLFVTRKKNKTDFDKYQDYLFKFGKDTLTSLTNAAGKGDILAVAEIQENIFGNMTDSTPAEIEKDEMSSVWTAQFDFEFHYDKPISVGIKYPLMIYNNLIPYVLYPEVGFDVNKIKMNSGLTREYYTRVQTEMGYNWHMNGAFIRIPEFDDWSNFIKWSDQRPLLSAMLTVDKDYPKYVCQLTDLGEWGLHPVLAAYFSRYHLYLTREYEFPFSVRMYCNDHYLGEDGIYIDNELHVESTHDMSIYKMHHLVITVLTDINQLSSKGKERFFNNPELVNAWLDIILGYVPKGGYPKVNSGGSVDVKDFERICRMCGIYGSNHKHGYKNTKIMNIGSLIATVGIFNVTTANTKLKKENANAYSNTNANSRASYAYLAERESGRTS